MLLGYCGSGYYGMQYNPPHKTIEGEILTKLFDVGAISEENSLAPKKNSFMAAARTDKGVHAMLNLLSLKITLREDTVAKLNAALPPEIRVWGIQPVNKKFNARSACDSRWYQYLIPEFILIGPPRSSLLHRNVGDATAKTARKRCGIRSWNRRVGDLAGMSCAVCRTLHRN